MSCNGCRVLRKGCSEGCALRPCLQWMETAEAQGFATLFLAKFFGRAGLMEFITAVPLSQRPALFQSLLYEACGRTVNPVHGAVGLLWSGKWHLCQEAVDTILSGGSLHTKIAYDSSTMPLNFGDLSSHSMKSVGPTQRQNALSHARPLALNSSFSMHTQMPHLLQKPSISRSTSFNLFEESHSMNNVHKKLKLASENPTSQSLVFQRRRSPQGVLGCNFPKTARRYHYNTATNNCSQTLIHQHSETQHYLVGRTILDKQSINVTKEEVCLALTLNSNEQGGFKSSLKDISLNIGRVSSPSEGSNVTSLGSSVLSSPSSQCLKKCPSSRSPENKKLLNLLT